jgi:hypothetical protein
MLPICGLWPSFVRVAGLGVRIRVRVRVEVWVEVSLVVHLLSGLLANFVEVRVGNWSS